ncbi:pentatricopeptide repeat-containing protein At3g48250, chloroplastic-like [Nicotiana tabacum]|uniref:pentatricopeptide repeat-containing protein At3g48250, chloroplastic-like n=1 Tax=Nicotiana tabacum TaxID=4097 RepID=UPI003F4EC2F3
MNQGKRILSSLRLKNSLFLTQLSRAPSPNPQVTHYFYLSPSLPTQICTSATILGAHQNVSFSSKPESFVDIILSNDWSKHLEKDLGKLDFPVTHEAVMYLLKKLDKDPKKAGNFLKWVIKQKRFEPSSAMYSLMLRIYANKDSMKDFWITIKEMKEKGFYIDEETYKSIHSVFRNLKMETDATALKHFYGRMIKENAMGDLAIDVSELIKKQEWGFEVERQLREMKLSVSDNFVLRVLKELREIGYPLKAFNFFKWVARSLGFQHNTVTYNGILRVLCREESIEEFWSVVEEMKSVGFEIDLDTYIKISRHFQKIRMLRDAVELYELMMDGQFKPSLGECNILLRSIAQSNPPDLDLLFRVVGKFEAAGHSRSKIIYDVIHRCLANLGRFEEAEKITEAMRDAGFEPDNITYSQLIYGLCKMRRLEEALNVIDAMEECGCIPDIKTWTVLIQGHCLAGEVDKALFCFAKMMEKNVDTDADLLDVLLNGFLSQRRVFGAYQLLIEMVNRFQMRPWQATYKLIIQKLLGERKFEEALDLLRRMKKHNYPPFPEPFHQYISKSGTVEDAVEFLKALSVKDYPSVSAYQHVFQTFFAEGRHSEAKDLLYKCPHHIRQHPAICGLFGSPNSNSGKVKRFTRKSLSSA